MNKVSVTIAIITLWIVTPFLFMAFNIGGFTELNQDLMNTIVSESEDFNLFTLSGFDTAIDFLWSLTKFTLFDSSLLVQGFYTLLTVITLVDIILILRGGGS